MPSCVLMIFIDMKKYYTQTEGISKYSGKQENYAIGLNSCYLFNLEHETEHIIDGANGFCMH